MTNMKLARMALLATVFSLPLGFAASAADLLILSPEPVAMQDIDMVLPAVSGPNGKIELDLGLVTDPDNATFRAAGSLSLPVGDAFGIQGDLGVESIGGEWSTGAALHVFTRNPASYLVGVAAGVVVSDGSTLAAIGPEAELYLDRVSLEGWAGWASLNYDDAFLDDETGFFAVGDLAYYATDDWRLSIGGASILGTESLKLATEYQLTGFGLPISATAELRGYDTGSVSAKIGIKGYFGDPDKTLIDRHRQDDPPNRVPDMMAAGDIECLDVELGKKVDPFCDGDKLK